MAAKASRAPLSRGRVLAAAVALVDGHGLPALTMRRLAVELGVEAMSLYYHLPDKETLLDGVAETVVDEVTAAVGPLAGDGAWKAVLRRQFLTARGVMLRHPWAPGLLGTRRTVPAGVFAVLRPDPRHPHRRRVHLPPRAPGAARLRQHAARLRPGGVQPGGGRRQQDVEDTEESLAAMAEAMPHLTAMVAAEMHAATDPTLGWCDSQVEFEFTLDLLLDGLDRLRA